MQRANVLTSTWSIAQLFAPWMGTISTKLGDEELQLRAALALHKWATSAEDGNLEEIAKIGAELEDKLMEAAYRRRAFESKGEEQQKFNDVADYSDAWTPDVKVWYICRTSNGKDWGKCNTPSSRRSGTASTRTQWQRGRDGTAGAARASTTSSTGCSSR